MDRQALFATSGGIVIGLYPTQLVRNGDHPFLKIRQRVCDLSIRTAGTGAFLQDHYQFESPGKKPFGNSIAEQGRKIDIGINDCLAGKFWRQLSYVQTAPHATSPTGISLRLQISSRRIRPDGHCPNGIILCY